MRKSNKLVAGPLILIGLAYGFATFQIRGREFTTNEVGPTAFPWLLVVLMVGLSASLLIGGKAGSASSQDGEKEEADEMATWRILAASLLFIGYVLSLSVVGFVWSSVVFLALFPLFFGLRRLSVVSVAGMAVGVPVVVYLFLWHVFGILLP